MGLMDILNQYTGAAAAPQANTNQHFDEVAQQASPDSLGSALGSMFRSSATPPFGSMVGQLFGQSNPDQRAGLLNTLIGSLGPAAMGAGGGVLGKLLGNRAGPEPNGAPYSSPTVTSAQASQLSPADATALASHAEQRDPSIVDTVGAFYAQHPALVKTLGVAALAVALGQMHRT